MSQSRKGGRDTPVPRPEPQRPLRKDVLSEGHIDNENSPTNPMLVHPERPSDDVEHERMIAEKLQRHGYEFITRIGEGGMGNVYLARDEALDRDVAVKVMNADMFGNEMARERFFKEARTLAKLNHPNITAVYALKHDKEDGYSFIVQEFLKGRDMYKVLYEDGPLENGRFKRLFMQVCDALGAAHEAGIIHRDMKPDNIFVIGANGTKEMVKIIDFGIAKVEDRKAGAAFRTQAGFILGSPEYMSPEQADGKPVDCRADVYSLGAVMYEMATGTAPFLSSSHETTPQALFANLFPKIMREQPELPSSRAPGRLISRQKEGIIMKCLEKDPARRFQSMDELREALEGLPDEEQTSFPLPEQPVPAEDHRVLPSVIVSPSLPGVVTDMSGANTSGLSEDDKIRQADEVPTEEGPLEGAMPSKGEKKGRTMLVGRRLAEKLDRRRRLIVAGVAGVTIGLGALAGVGYFMAGNRNGPAAPEAQVSAPRTEPRKAPPPLAPPAPVEEPTQAAADAGAEEARPAAGDAGVIEPADAVKTYMITFKTTPQGVGVFSESGARVCTTAPDADCSVSIQDGFDPMTFRFRKRGFVEEQRTVGPGSDQTVEVTLNEEPVKVRPPVVRPPTRPRDPPAQQGGNNVPFTVESNIRDEKKK